MSGLTASCDHSQTILHANYASAGPWLVGVMSIDNYLPSPEGCEGGGSAIQLSHRSQPYDGTIPGITKRNGKCYYRACKAQTRDGSYGFYDCVCGPRSQTKAGLCGVEQCLFPRSVASKYIHMGWHMKVSCTGCLDGQPVKPCTEEEATNNPLSGRMCPWQVALHTPELSPYL